MARKRSVETDAERLEEETAHTAEADSDKRVALKRKAEGDPSDPEVEDSAMNSHSELWHIACVHENSGDKPVCEEPKTHSPYDECGWDYIDDTGGKLLNNTLVEKARSKKKILSSVSLMSGRWWTDPVTRSCWARCGLTSTRETRPNRSTVVD